MAHPTLHTVAMFLALRLAYLHTTLNNLEQLRALPKQLPRALNIQHCRIHSGEDLMEIADLHALALHFLCFSSVNRDKALSDLPVRLGPS